MPWIDIIFILFVIVSILLSVFTYYAYLKKDKQTEKTALLVSTIVFWVVSLILLIYIFFRGEGNKKTDNYSQPTNDIDPRKDDSIRFALTHLKTALREIGNLTKRDEEHDDYFVNVNEKIRNSMNLTNTEKKKLAIDYFRYHEYFTKDVSSGNIIASPNGKALAKELTGYEDIDLDFLLRKFGQFKTNFENNTNQLTRNDLPEDVETFEAEVKDQKEKPEFPVNVLNRPKPLYENISLLDYYVNSVNLQNKREEARVEAMIRDAQEGLLAKPIGGLVSPEKSYMSKEDKDRYTQKRLNI